MVRVPFSLYLGCITAATLANISEMEWLGDQRRELVAGAIIASLVSLTRGDIAYVLVIVWAFAGIAVKQSGTPLVAITAAVLAAVVLLTLLAGVPLTRRRLQGEQGPEVAVASDRW